MFRDPDQALDNLHDLAHRMHDNLQISRKYSELPVEDAQLHNMAAQFIEQFQWLDEHLSNHGTIPTDWRSASFRPYGPKEPHGDALHA